MKVLILPFRLAAFFGQCVQLAMAQIWLHKTKAALTTIGIFIGVAATVGVTAGMIGFKAKVLYELESLGTGTIFLGTNVPDTGPKSSMTHFELRWLPEHFEGLVEHCPSVAAVARLVWIRGGARHSSIYTDEIDLFGVSHEYMDAFNIAATHGRQITADDQANRRHVCVVDERVVEALNLSPEGVGETIVMLGRTWHVVGVADALFKGSFINFDDNTPNIYVPFETVYERDSGQMGVFLTSSSPEVVEEAVGESTFFLRRTRGIGPGEPDDFSIQSVQKATDMFGSWAASITVVAAAVVGISLLVGGVGIMNIMLVSVTERTREIGLRKAVGASSTAVLFQFLVEAVAVCFLGGILGVLAGQGLALALRFVPGEVFSMASVPWWSVALAFVFCTAVGLFFGIFPAVRAARLDPIEALRHE